MALLNPYAVYSDGFPTKQLTVTAASNATPIVITTSAVHGLQEGNLVTIVNVGGNTAANVTGNAISIVDRFNFSLNSVAGNGAYTSGGTVQTIVGGQLVAALSAPDARRVQGTFETTGGDGSDVAFTVNFIDGTSVLPFTPTAILISRIPATTGANEAASSIVASVTTLANTSFVVTLSAAPASGKDMKFAFQAWA